MVIVSRVQRAEVQERVRRRLPQVEGHRSPRALDPDAVARLQLLAAGLRLRERQAEVTFPVYAI